MMVFGHSSFTRPFLVAAGARWLLVVVAGAAAGQSMFWLPFAAHDRFGKPSHGTGGLRAKCESAVSLPEERKGRIMRIRLPSGR